MDQTSKEEHVSEKIDLPSASVADNNNVNGENTNDVDRCVINLNASACSSTAADDNLVDDSPQKLPPTTAENGAAGGSSVIAAAADAEIIKNASSTATDTAAANDNANNTTTSSNNNDIENVVVKESGNVNQVEDALVGSLPDDTESPLIEDCTVTVIHGSKKYPVNVNLDENVLKFKGKVEKLTGISADMQKVICKGTKLIDTSTLRACKVENGSKLMLIGSQLTDVFNVSELPAASTLIGDPTPIETSREPLCRQREHAKVLEKGMPDDIMPGIKNEMDPLPRYPITGLYNKHGSKVRLTFKLEADQVWISTKERTDKIPMSQIKHVFSEAIENHEEYHIMALQLGPTELSRYYLYWVPAQYVVSIRSTILGP